MAPGLILLLAAGFVASFASGVAEFAFAAVAAALMLRLGPPDVIVPLILAGSILSQLVSLVALRRAVRWDRLWPFLLAGVAGVPLGTAALGLADPHAFRVSTGAVLIAFSLWALLRPAPAPVAFGGSWADALAGLIGGAMGGFAGLSGIVPTLWCGARGWPAQEQRAVYQPFILVIQVCALLSGSAAGLFSPASIGLAVMLRPRLPCRDPVRALDVQAVGPAPVSPCRSPAGAPVRSGAAGVTPGAAHARVAGRTRPSWASTGLPATPFWRSVAQANSSTGESMSETFRALRVSKAEGGKAPDVAVTELREDELMEGDVTVAVRHSTVNYKDGLALTGKAPILRRSPMTPGIDFAGEVLSAAGGEFAPGDRVILNGWGVGETHDGGFAERARVKGEWLIRLPERLSMAQAMAVGTAGYTAALSVLALERLGLANGADVLVTGAAGGLGSVAIALLAAAGHRVTASSRRAGEEREYLRGLGAEDVIDAGELSGPGRPLAKERWAAAVDCVGSHTLANVLAGTRYGGVVAACGLAQGPDLPATVMPFILRGVTLAGIDSVMTPRRKREEAWSRLARDLDPGKLDMMTEHVTLEDVPRAGREIVEGRVRGRLVVDL